VLITPTSHYSRLSSKFDDYGKKTSIGKALDKKGRAISDTASSLWQLNTNPFF